MDVEPNPGPQQIRISNLPNSIKLLFNQVKRTRLKITRYQSHLDNLLAYKSNNLVPKGLKPKCTPAIHSSNPSFWSKWQKNLDNLASVQLDLLLDETNNCIRQLKSTFDNQQQVLRASLNNDTLNAKLSNDMEDMASKLQLNLNQLRTKKLNNMLHTRTSTDRANLQTNNSLSSCPYQEPILQMIPSNDSISVAPTTHPDYPDTTDEDGDVAQEFYVEFGGKMFQYDPEILTAEQFLASLKEKQKSTSSVSINNGSRGSPISSGTTTHPSPRNANPPRSQKKRKNRRSRSKRHKTSSQQPEDTVINLSNVELSEAEIKLLSRGLTFVPTPQRINWSEIQADIDDFARRLRLKEFFDKDGNTATDASSHPFRCKGS